MMNQQRGPGPGAHGPPPPPRPDQRDRRVSNWVPTFENSVLEELECDDPYMIKEELVKNKKFLGKIKSVQLVSLGSTPSLTQLNVMGVIRLHTKRHLV